VLAGTNLEHADLRGSDLRGAFLKDADLSHAARATGVFRSAPIINLPPTARRGRTRPTAITRAARGWRQGKQVPGDAASNGLSTHILL
jgi:hypothetical protein